MANGWIHQPRNEIDSAIWQSGDLALQRVWDWCKYKFTYRPFSAIVGNDTVELEPGQFVCGELKGSKECAIPVSTFRRKLILLEKLNEVSLNRKRHYTVVTVINWRLYQEPGSVGEAQVERSRSETEAQEKTYKNIKNTRIDQELGQQPAAAPVQKRKRDIHGNPKPDELLTLITGPHNGKLATEYATCYNRHLAEVHQRVSMQTLRVLLGGHEWPRLYYAMMLVVSKGWRSINRALEYMDERKDDPKFAAHYSAFRDQITTPEQANEAN